MKIRNDFVTNSSSSSFIIVGKQVKVDEVDLSQGNYLFHGRELCEGYDVVEIDNEILNYLKSYGTNKYGDIYLGNYPVSIIKYFAKRCLDDKDNCTFTINELRKYINENEPFEIISIEEDYHSSKNVLDLKDIY